ncbi:PadR family transcriptional regulator [Brochothrix campestris]|uniref:Transcription regulator n=1 Tax=Brochothrix campestris FSL F6-1037 TaxID=1265861 RepID=W7D1J4_9LIST|nr:PadR family transcriptional regulator [Brochothrix campestris]EUJ41781.1 transcription regulator [Brochothrix campestris FSL F6-1037]
MNFQMGAALLDYCVLGVLAREDAYGYALTVEVKKVMTISESTLYPVLRRLKKEAFVTTYDEAFQGRNRRYYQITATGLQRKTELAAEWTEFIKKIEMVVEGEKKK